MGHYPKNAPAKDFDFAAAYDPLSFSGARFCEARVWNIFAKLTDGMEDYLDYAQGYNLTNPMPLFIKPSKKMAVNARTQSLSVRLLVMYGSNLRGFLCIIAIDVWVDSSTQAFYRCL